MLSNGSFKVVAKEVSLPFQSIEGMGSPPPWFSPKPEHSTMLAADLAVLREADRRGAMRLLDDTWAGAIGDITSALHPVRGGHLPRGSMVGASASLPWFWGLRVAGHLVVHRAVARHHGR